MQPLAPIVSLPLPPLLAACLDFGDSSETLIGTITTPRPPTSHSPDPAATNHNLHDDVFDAHAVSVDVINHVEREYWGLRFSGAVELESPRSIIACDSHVLAAIPHGPCVWLRYNLQLIPHPLPRPHCDSHPAATTRPHPMTSAPTSLPTSHITTVSSAVPSTYSELPPCGSPATLRMDCPMARHRRTGAANRWLLQGAIGAEAAVFCLSSTITPLPTAANPSQAASGTAPVPSTDATARYDTLRNMFRQMPSVSLRAPNLRADVVAAL